MADIQKNFVAGKMNKSVDERLVPNGQYVDALNVRLGSTEASEIGSVENALGNTSLTMLNFNSISLSDNATCIGSIHDSQKDTIYWFVHDSSFTASATGKIDMILSYNTNSDVLAYHVISSDDGGGQNTTLNFDPKYLITGVNKIDDLLFFTDNFNPPRVINVMNNYENPANYIDRFSSEDILVIKKPPFTAPTLVMTNVNNNSDFITERFISFAYRYLYENGEYSATSPWSEIAFNPKAYKPSVKSGVNDGMVNQFNAVDVTFNTGGELVVGVDLLFKESESNVIKVIEKINKSNLGYSDNTKYSFTFSNSKIFTVLPESELLRLYDNVPHKAKAQTLMGNRLIYGNYIDGYDLKDEDGQPIDLRYNLSLNSVDATDAPLTVNTTSTSYTVGNFSTTIQDSSLSFEIPIDIFPTEIGAELSFEYVLEHDSFHEVGAATAPVETSEDIIVSLIFPINKVYNNINELITSDEFTNIIGVTGGNILSVQDSCNGFTFTDTVNCSIPAALGSYEKQRSGITQLDQAIAISLSGNTVTLSNIAMEFKNNSGDIVFEYYKIVGIPTATYNSVGNPKSLHSNRSYEVSMIYVDDYNRATTALVSNTNTISTPPSSSITQNKIQVNIPTSQTPPYWAKGYKFAIKSDGGSYKTIFSNIAYLDPITNDTYFLLEGENSAKVEEGDVLIVKTDVNGARTNKTLTTVLEKKSQEADFIEPINPAGGDPLEVPSGVYIKLNATSFSTANIANAVISPGEVENTRQSRNKPWIIYPMNKETSPGVWEDYTVPENSRVSFYFKGYRRGYKNRCTSDCERAIYTIDLDLVSSRTYSNMYDFFIGDNVADLLNQGVGECDTNYTTELIGSNNPAPRLVSSFERPSPQTAEYAFEFQRDNVTSQMVLSIQSNYKGCGDWSASSSVSAEVTVYRADSTFIFETQPDETAPDIFFESPTTYPIVNGFHQGNVANQSPSQAGIVLTDFFNCFSFGNGSESYKIKDSIKGKAFGFGERVTAVASQDYKEAKRKADLTYSGVYNNENNVNKLNEFNLGLVNYKSLEESFGSIQKLYARSTDILTLQEDKISYVLAGKNLLSDAAAGGAITSIPEVLGTQIARLEDYGISENPESFAQFGFNKYFTDQKRGAVLQLKGGSYNNEQLSVISTSGMRSYFRDLFTSNVNTQKLGGYDPYHDEYILTVTDTSLPVDSQCVNCGITIGYDFSIDANAKSFCVELGSNVGTSTIDYVVSGGSYNITVNFDGEVTSSGAVTNNGSFTFNKTNALKLTATVTVTGQASVGETLQLTTNCVSAEPLTIIQLALTANYDAEQSIHYGYDYSLNGYNSPRQDFRVEMIEGTTPIVSEYFATSGDKGQSNMPTNGSTVTMYVTKQDGDTFDWEEVNDELRFYTSNTLYTNNATDINTLVSVSNEATYLVSKQIEVSVATAYGEAGDQANCCGEGLNQNFFIPYNESFINANTLYVDAALTIPTAVASGLSLHNSSFPTIQRRSAGNGNIISGYTACPNCEGAGNQDVPLEIFVPTIYAATFTMPNTSDAYLYLLYRTNLSTSKLLCYDSSDSYDVCCDCISSVWRSVELKTSTNEDNACCAAVNTGVYYFAYAETDWTTATVLYTDVDLSIPAPNAFYVEGDGTGTQPVREISDGNGTLGLLSNCAPCTSLLEVGYDANDADGVCCEVPSTTNVYVAQGETFQTATNIYSEDTLNVPAADGFYAASRVLTSVSLDTNTNETSLCCFSGGPGTTYYMSSQNFDQVVTFNTAHSIWLDEEGTVAAPAGYYIEDVSGTNTRQILNNNSGLLENIVACASCTRSVFSSSMNLGSSVACTTAPEFYYTWKNVGNTASTPELGDVVYYLQTGGNYLSAGNYYMSAGSRIYTINNNGAVVQIQNCV